jgi:hypothetical protein
MKNFVAFVIYDPILLKNAATECKLLHKRVQKESSYGRISYNLLIQNIFCNFE